MTDLLNAFAEAADKEKHLQCYRGLIRRARPYTLDDDATALITELASGPTINDKLATYRILARLPFETVWIELNYEARYYARVALGTSFGDKPKDTPDRMGWLLERLSDTTWRATTVIRYAHPEATESGRTVDTFGAVHVISTEGPVDFRSFVRDPIARQAVQEINKPHPDRGSSIIAALAWGFGEQASRPKAGESKTVSIGLPEHLHGANAVDLATSWEPIMHRVSKGLPSVKIAKTKKHMLESAIELQGDLRFLMAALATINEVPLTYADFRPPGTRRIAGGMKQFMVNRVVTIAIPKKRGRTNKVMKMLRLAEVRMRRHEVGGYWKRVHFKDRVELRWIGNYWRGDSALGYVNQEREVVESA